MARIWNIRLQAALVLVLFFGSLAALLYNTFTTLTLPRRELLARTQLLEVSRAMAQSAAAALQSLPPGDAVQFEQLHQTLRSVTHRILTEFSNVEGGFYLGDDIDRFSGYAFPTGRKAPYPEPYRTEPPPFEAPYIRTQAQQSLAGIPGQPLWTSPGLVDTFGD